MSRIKNPKENTKYRDKIACHRSVSILCWPVTPAIVAIGKTEKSVDILVIDNGLTISIKKTDSNWSIKIEDCVCWQCCIGHITYKMMTSIETVNKTCIVLSTCLSVASIWLLNDNTSSIYLVSSWRQQQMWFLFFH